nr:PIN domain-containing protein [Haloplanus sp. GDY1]
MGHLYLSEYVFDEVITVTRKWTGSFAVAKRLSGRLRGQDEYPHVLELLYLSPAIFADAIGVFEQDTDQELSFIDVTTVAVANQHRIDQILSFDDDFDGVVQRLDPPSV